MAYIGLDRGIVDHWIYKDAEYFKVWFEILYRARYSKEPERKLEDGKVVVIECGQFMYGRTRWCQRLGVSERRMRTLFDRLLRDEMIQVVAKYPKFTIYSVVNYEKYNSPETRQNLAENSPETDQQSDQQQTQSGQGFADIGDQHDDRLPTSKRPASDQQTTTQEEGSKKVNQGKKKTLKTYTPEFEEFWKVYPRKKEKQVAFTAWNAAIKSDSSEFIISCASNYAKECEVKGTQTEFIKHPQTFLNKERYRDYKVILLGGGANAKHGARDAGPTEEDRRMADKDAGFNAASSYDYFMGLSKVQGHGHD